MSAVEECACLSTCVVGAWLLFYVLCASALPPGCQRKGPPPPALIPTLRGPCSFCERQVCDSATAVSERLV